MISSHKLIAIAGVLGGLSLATIGITHAQTASTGSTGTSSQSSVTTADTATTTGPPQFDQTRGGHVGANGVKEELLTGTTAEKTKAAALAAVPGGTIQRVENDAEGAAYEAHMLKSDGSAVTVKLDANFNVTNTESGPGMKPTDSAPAVNPSST